ncbi:hypothetical protein EX30DRAFT_337006 [Ascodesmis nigricans]|uniref:Zinc metalloprotease n=1 Tax=Ascodesmis nigricans TaxID=341454 RepID=A0A4S2N5H7_9PEZI|nr:hypothetical protein EX30DRAFT_337006 [Ascodesmis nigricans]
MMPSNFRTVTSFKTDYSTSNVTKYESTRTGLTAVVVDRKGPKVHGFFALATEILDDSGAPHTLEHLVFMGSRSYEYKGVLDQLATRAYSETNAWTATDHTVYTLDTAGWAGFRQILPVYLEHILLPTLTDSACVTEVYHIDGAGHDAGVVYSEMQGVQNTQESLMNEAANKMLYPEGVGFRYETGGMMDALRVLTNERIRDFHKEMYQPKNLCVIIVGDVDHAELLETLDKFEDSVIDAIPDPSKDWKRPWVDSPPVPLLKESKIETVEFPEKDESTGEVIVAYLGPDAMDPIASKAMSILSTYLAGSSVSVLENQLVEIEDPWASSVSFYSEKRPNTVVWVQMTAVATKKLAEAEKQLFKVLQETVEKPLNMDYLKQIIRRTKRQQKWYLEMTGHMLSKYVIMDHCFGTRDGAQLKALTESLNMYDTLLSWSEQQWQLYIKKWLIDNPRVSILGKPSAKLAKKIEEDEKSRIDERVKKLGEKGLAELQKKLDDAKAENEKPIPEEVLSSFKVPEVDTIHFIETKTARGGLAKNMDGPGEKEAQDLIDADDTDVPLYIHFEHGETEFAQIDVMFSTESIPVKLRPLIPIYFENFFNTPVMKDGVRVEYEQVVSQLEDVTIDYNIERAHYVDLPESIRIRFHIEMEKYAEAINWIRILLRDAIFDEKRLSVTVSKLLSDIPDEKRDGRGMSASVRNMINLAPGSISRASDTLVKSRYLKRINSLLSTSPSEAISLFQEFNTAFADLSNIRILVIANLSILPNPVSTWKSFTSSLPSPAFLSPLDRRTSRLSSTGQSPGNSTHIVPLPSIDSSFSQHMSLGPTSLLDPSLPALMVALAFLTATEGPLWKAARGSGLAYGVKIHRHLDSGHLSLMVYRSPDAFKAFKAVKELIKSYADGTISIDSLTLEGAVSTIINEFADMEPNFSGAGTMSFVHQVVHGVPKDYNMRILKKVKEVKEEDVRKVLSDMVMKLFEPETSNVVVVAAARMCEGLKEAFKKDGFTTAEVKGLRDFEDDYGVKYGLKEGEEEEEDEDEDEESGSGSEDESEDESEGGMEL